MKFLIIGETCSDRFCYGTAKRLCPEAPAPVFVPDYGLNNLGMAYNVYKNLLAIDRKTHKNISRKSDINIFTNEPEGHKTRYIDSESNQMFLRIDTDTYPICQDLPENIEEYDTVVVSDYDKGFIKDSHLVEIGKRSKLSFLDTKKRYNSDWASFYSFIKINEKEHNENGWKYMSSNLIVTKAAKGCWYKEKDYPINTPSEVRDVSGAGDTFLAGLAYAYTTTKDMDSSIIFAQDCCKKVVRKKGVSTI